MNTFEETFQKVTEPLAPLATKSVEELEEDAELGRLAEEALANGGKTVTVTLEELCTETIAFSAVKQTGSEVESFAETKLKEMNMLEQQTPAMESEAALDETFALAADPVVEGGRGKVADFTHIDDSPFIQVDIPGAAEAALVGGQTLNTPLESETDFLLQGKNAEVLNQSIEQLQAGQVMEKELIEEPEEVLAAIEKGREEMNDPNTEVERTEVKVAHIGSPTNLGLGAAALLAAGLATPKETATEDNGLVEQPVPGNLPDRPFMSNAERKRRAALEHNANIKPGKFVIVQMRPEGLKLRLEILHLTNREVQLSKKCGNFAIFTKNTAVSASRINYLPTAQHMNRSMINPQVLDWILDQLDENTAFEIRNNRMTDKTPRKFVIEKTEAEWKFKGFNVRNNNLIIA